MSSDAFKAQAYLLNSCPFCFKFLLFMTEAQLLDRIEIIRIDPQATDFETVKAKLAASTQSKVTFPTVEIEPGIYKSDSDQLINYFAAPANVAPDKLPVLSFYKEGLFANYIKLYKENVELKQKLSA